MWRNLQLHLYKRDSISLLLISVIIDYKQKVLIDMTLPHTKFSTSTQRYLKRSYMYVDVALPQNINSYMYVDAALPQNTRSYMYEDVALPQNIRSYMYEDAALPQNIRFYMYVCHTVIYWILFYKI